MVFTYRKTETIVAVRMDLDMDMGPLRYRKWGGEQTAKPGDWLVLSNGDTYTIDADEFAKTYAPLVFAGREEPTGHFRKTAITYAFEASKAGTITTLEGESDFEAGDYICASNPEMLDGYPVSRETFEATYEVAE
jgi:hypothetical protein